MPRYSKSRSRSRSRERRKHGRSSSKHSDRHRSDSHDHRDRHRDKHRRRSRSSSRDADDRRKGRSPRKSSPRQSPERRRSPERDAEQEKKQARLEKLKAWKQQQAAAAPATEAPAAAPAAPSGQASWTPWDDPELAGGADEAAPVAPSQPSLASGPAIPGQPAIPISVARRRAAFEKEEAEKLLKAQQEDAEEDPLDAFMAAEVLPEVTAKQEAERKAKEEERQRKAALLAEGKVPKLEQILESDSEEETPDVELQLPAHKIKLMIGAGGEKIKYIQRKSKCRIQVKKEEKELERGFGTGPILTGVPRGIQKDESGEVKMVTVMLFGDAEQCHKARDMIDEALENREQKAKQRHKEYERKKEAKARDRQLYHLRHTRDYEALGVPIGTSKADIKKAYRQLAKVWHPDKHPDNQEEAKLKFQEIQRAYESLMTTDEDARIEALGHK